MSATTSARTEGRPNRSREYALLRTIGGVVLVLAGCASDAPSSTEPAPPEPSPSATAAQEISRDEAIDLARAALRALGEDWEVVAATEGTVRQVRPNWKDYPWAERLSGDLRVWSVAMVSGDLSAQVLLDPLDGSVHGYVAGVAN